ncbi:MAG: SH3 domain-containing protein [Firmicutes bacterium]|nr:SH3 domain-containing protein [Bacillota bacterium]
MRRRLVFSCFTLCLALLLTAVWGAGAALAATVTVNQPKVNVRSGPGTTYSKVGEAKADERLEVLETRDEWIKVRLPSGKDGWVWSPLVDSEMADDTTFFVVTVDRANVRKGPATSEALLGSVSRGATLRATAQRGKWVKVAWESGYAWIYAPLGQLKTLDPADLLVGKVERTVYVNRANTPVRSWPGSTANVIARLGAGATAKYAGSESGWVQVQWSGKSGWVEGKDVRVNNAAPFLKSVNYDITDDEWSIRPSMFGKVKGTFVNLRNGPGTNHKQIGRLKGGQVFKILGSQSGWYQITTDTGQTGWISSSLAQVTYTPVIRRVSLRASSAYRKDLVIEGSFGSPLVRQVEGGKTLAVWAQNKGGSPSKLDLNAFELGTISLNENGVRVDFTEKPSLKVVESKPGRVVVSLETTVTGVTVEKKAGRDVVSVSTLGYVDPSLRPRDGGAGIDLVIPGAALTGQPGAGSRGQFIKAVRAGRNDNGVSISLDVASWKRHIARRSPNLFTVEFLEPGLAGKTLVLDPGHGGRDPGAIGQRGLYEKVPNLKIALALKAMLEREGAKVVMTRSDDSGAEPPQGEQGENGHAGDLSARVARVADSGADLFLSIHNNANVDRSKSGSTLYYAASTLNAEASRTVADALQSELVRVLGRADNGVRRAEFYVARTCPVPSVVAEVVFISNAEEESLLQSDEFCRRAASALLAGLKKYYS